MHSFLESLSATAQRRDLAHGLPRGNYMQRWLTMLSCTLNKAISRAIFDSLYYSAPSPNSPIDPATVLTQDQVTSALRDASGLYGLRMHPFPRPAISSTTIPVTPIPTDAPSHPAVTGMRELTLSRNTVINSLDHVPEEDLLSVPAMSDAPFSAHPFSGPVPLSETGALSGLHS